jgi:flagellum-specific ATP synthase
MEIEMPDTKLDLKKYESAVAAAKPVRLHGKVTQVVGLVIEGFCSDTSVGAICEIKPLEGEPIPAEVVGFRNSKTLLMPLGELRGVGLDSLITVRRDNASLGVGPSM